jgi:hypothetical protein
MKTIRKTFNAIIAIMLTFATVSCINSKYMMITKINPDGSCFREIYAKGDSAFLAGNLSNSPYMFRLDSGWQITPLGATGEYNVKISKTARTVEEFSTGLKFNEELRALIAPEESIQKHFGWFYSYYTFKSGVSLHFYKNSGRNRRLHE